eukprot:4770602-Pleurochrysis_carterae.AAC.1
MHAGSLTRTSHTRQRTTAHASNCAHSRAPRRAACACAVAQVASLLGLEQAEDLSNALTTRRLVTRDDVVTVPLNLEQSSDSRDGAKGGAEKRSG